MSRLALLTGGTSAEREIALRSAAHVAEALTPRHEIVTFDFPRDRELYLDQYQDFACAIPMFHGKGGEDGEIQGFLKTLGVSFVFSDVSAHAIAMDKVVTKTLVAAHGIATPPWQRIHADEHATYRSPIVIKPTDAGSSIGIRIARSQAELDAAIAHARQFSQELLLEDYIEGEEYTCAVIEERGACMALPVILIRSKKSFFDLESKYDPTLAEEICPAPISQELAERIQDIARRAHLLVRARHVSRSDVIVDAEQRAWFLEINTIPGMTNESLFPKALRASGRNLADVFEEWIQTSLSKK